MGFGERRRARGSSELMKRRVMSFRRRSSLPVEREVRLSSATSGRSRDPEHPREFQGRILPRTFSGALASAARRTGTGHSGGNGSVTDAEASRCQFGPFRALDRYGRHSVVWANASLEFPRNEVKDARVDRYEMPLEAGQSSLVIVSWRGWTQLAEDACAWSWTDGSEESLCRDV
jgi:hypothetical protein